MINTLARVDQLASAGRTVWHRAGALTKLSLAGAVVAAAVFSPSLSLLVTLHLLVWILALTSRIPGRLLTVAAGYPLLIAALFVLASWDGSWNTPLRLVLRPLTASVAVVWLVGTTPYPDLFAPLSRLLPRSIGDGLFITYRALFELIGRAERLWRALRIRGGGALPARQRFQLAGLGLGTLVLYGFERSQRLYATMLLRGHTGRICGCRHYAELGRADLVVLGVAVLFVAAVLGLWGAP